MYQAVSVFYTANDKSIKVVCISSLLLPYTYMHPRRNVSALMMIQCVYTLPSKEVFGHMPADHEGYGISEPEA